MHSALDSESSTANPNHCQLLATHFLRSLALIDHLMNTRETSSLQQRSHLIRRAAYASMAKATGPGKAWSRAIMLPRRLHGQHARPRAPAGYPGLRIHERIRIRIRVAKPPPAREPSCANTLRTLVPGGKAMDLSTLLDEAANFVHCLSKQVGLMHTIVTSVSQQEPIL